MKQRKHKIILTVALVLGAACAFVFVAVLLSLISVFGFNRDYRSEPPEKVFTWVFGEPVPKGVSELRVSGRSQFTKSWIWMRFRATDKAIAALTKDLDTFHASDKNSLDDIERAIQGDYGVGNARYNDVDKKAVGWSAVAQIAKPEVYWFSTLHGGESEPHMIWSGYLIVDGQNHLVYVTAGGD